MSPYFQDIRSLLFAPHRLALWGLEGDIVGHRASHDLRLCRLEVCPGIPEVRSGLFKKGWLSPTQAIARLYYALHDKEARLG